LIVLFISKQFYFERYYLINNEQRYKTCKYQQDEFDKDFVRLINQYPANEIHARDYESQSEQDAKYHYPSACAEHYCFGFSDFFFASSKK
jgi:hypothetical protein